MPGIVSKTDSGSRISKASRPGSSRSDLSSSSTQDVQEQVRQLTLSEEELYTELYGNGDEDDDESDENKKAEKKVRKEIEGALTSFSPKKPSVKEDSLDKVVSKKPDVEHYLAFSKEDFQPACIFLDQQSLNKYDESGGLEDDLDFVVREELTANKGPDSIYRRQQVTAIIRNSVDTNDLFKGLCGLPESDTTMKLKVNLPGAMSPASQKKALGKEGLRRKDELMKIYGDICKKVDEIRLWSTSRTPHMEAEIEEKLNEAKRLLAMKVTYLAEAVAYAFLANGRFCGGFVFLSGSKVTAVVERVAFVLSGDSLVSSNVKPALVREKVLDSIAQKAFFDPDVPYHSYRLQKSPRSFEKVSRFYVTCREMPEPKKYFEQCFLNSDDRVYSWVSVSSNFFLEGSPKGIDVPKGYMAFRASVQLPESREMLPLRATPERWQRRLAEDFEESQDMQLVDCLIDLLKDKFASKKAFKERKALWEDEKKEFGAGAEVNVDEVEARQSTEDPWDMTCYYAW